MENRVATAGLAAVAVLSVGMIVAGNAALAAEAERVDAPERTAEVQSARSR